MADPLSGSGEGLRMLSYLRRIGDTIFGLFRFADEVEEKQHFGFGHFVILLTLTPFILSMGLYYFSDVSKVPSWYQGNYQRFISAQAPTKPAGDRQCFLSLCPEVEAYPLRKAIFEKMPPAELEVKAYASSTVADILQEKSRSVFGDQIYTGLIFLGLGLYLPCAILCVIRRRFEMLIFGLCIPPAFGLTAAGLLNEQLAMFAAPKIALAWLILRGRPLSRPIVVGLTLLTLLAVAGAVETLWLVLALIIILVASGIACLVAKLWQWIPNALTRLRPGFRWGRPVAAVILCLPAGLVLYMVYIGLCVLGAGAPDFGLVKVLLPIVLFVMILALGRLIVTAIAVNAYFIKAMGLWRTLRVTAHAAILWLPMLVLTAPYFILTEHLLPKWTTDALYEAHIFPNPYDHELRDNSLQATALAFDEKLFRFHVAMETIKAEVRAQAYDLRANGLKARVLREFDTIFPSQMEMEPIHTGVPLIGGLMDDGLALGQEKANESYMKLRASLRTNVEESVSGLDQQFNEAVTTNEQRALDIVTQVKTKATDGILDANHSTQSAIWTTMIYVGAVHSIGLMLFLSICIRSFLYVFARVAFHRNMGTVVTLGRIDDSPPAMPPARITPTGGQYVIPDDHEATYYVSRRFQCRGKAPRFSIPQPFHAPIARLLHGATTMNKIVMKRGEGTVSCTAARGAQFLVWDLADGEVVIFDFHNFVGISESLQLSTLISTRLTSLLLGKFIFSKAIGPGKLILMTDGRAEITGDGQVAESLPPERLVAMHLDTRLNVESELNIVDVYLSTAYVRPAAGGQVIVDVDSQRGSRPGLGRFFLHFLWPG